MCNQYVFIELSFFS